MGNSRSQPCRRSRPSYLFYLIQKTWAGKPVEAPDKEDPDEAVDRRSEVSSSRCSDCKTCHYRQDSLTFDSESEMAPNAEEELLAVKPWGPQPEKERLRPPTYNAEDYAIALRRWGRRPVVTSHESHGTLPSTTSSSSGYASGCGEMTLRQFTSVSELLNKLRADLRLAFPSFVQEFASPPADGMTLLLETLRGVQLIQSSPPSGQGGPRIGTRRVALDELGCVECLAACGERCPDAPRLLSQAQPGLLALAVCLTSSLNRSRVLALQLLTKVCQAPGGHLAVSEAVSTLRLRYGEGGRFRFLAGALLAPRAAAALRVAGMSFLNAFLKSAPRTQTRLYIQAEACEAGLEPRVVQSWLSEVDVRSEDSLSDLLHKEVQKWSHNCVDVDALQKRLARAEETCALLGNKVSILQEQLSKYNRESKTSGYGGSDQDGNNTKSTSSMDEKTNTQKCSSSNAEDEGISSSERSSSPEELDRGMGRVENDSSMGCMDNDQETTIDDVIEELRIIVKDAEEEYEDRKPSKLYTGSTKDGSSLSSEKKSVSSRLPINRQRPKNDEETYFPSKEDEELSVDSAITRKLGSSTCSEKASRKLNQDGGLKIIVKNPEFEDAIVPAILYPQPPRRAPPCLSTILSTRDQPDFLDNPIGFNDHQDEEDIEEETLDDGSDSLLSASRLKYVTKNDDISNLPTDLENRQFYDIRSPQRSNEEPPIDNLKKSHETVDLRPKTGIRNFENVAKCLEDGDSTKKYFHVYKQFESGGKVAVDDTTTVQKRLPARYKSETEKRKLPRRSASQDVLGSTGSSSGKSRIEGRIRKFESLTAFENARLDGGASVGSSEKTSRISRSIIKRSESFHHVSMGDRESSERCNGAGSDSGLLYITDYDLEPLVNRKNVRDGFPRFTNYSTKSLNRIDESHTNEPPKRLQTSRSSKDKQEKKSPEKSSRNKMAPTKQRSERIKRNETADDDSRNVSGHLRNDELYNDQRSWSFKVESENRAPIKNFAGKVTTMMIGGSNQNGHEKLIGKYSTNDPGGFLPSGRYDAFGLAKSRFNAGKYSGNSQPSRHPNDIGPKRHSNASLVPKRGKVTDILSGLY